MRAARYILGFNPNKSVEYIADILMRFEISDSDVLSRYFLSLNPRKQCEVIVGELRSNLYQENMTSEQKNFLQWAFNKLEELRQ